MMNYQEFCKILETELPFNRKERFFTGTVLPALLFHNGLDNLIQFLAVIRGLPKEINLKTTEDKFLFYTEYNLMQSAGNRCIGAKIPVQANDTPDIMIEILFPQRIFIMIEAKMFDKVSQEALKSQILRQKEIIGDTLIKKYGLTPNQVIPVALVPQKLNIKSCQEYQVIHWEYFLNSLQNIKSNYFYNYLKYALDNYDNLVSLTAFEKASTVEYYMTGKTIYESKNNISTHWVGRKGGEREIIEDIKKGKWRSFKYSMNSEKPEKGRHGNWIPIIRFCELVDIHSS